MIISSSIIHRKVTSFQTSFKLNQIKVKFCTATNYDIEIVRWRLEVTTQVRDIVDFIIFFISGIYKNPFPGGWHYTTLEQIEIMAQQWGPVPKNAGNINFQAISSEKSLRTRCFFECPSHVTAKIDCLL